MQVIVQIEYAVWGRFKRRLHHVHIEATEPNWTERAMWTCLQFSVGNMRGVILMNMHKCVVSRADVCACCIATAGSSQSSAVCGPCTRGISTTFHRSFQAQSSFVVSWTSEFRLSKSLSTVGLSVDLRIWSLNCMNWHRFYILPKRRVEYLTFQQACGFFAVFTSVPSSYWANSA